MPLNLFGIKASSPSHIVVFCCIENQVFVVLPKHLDSLHLFCSHRCYFFGGQFTKFGKARQFDRYHLFLRFYALTTTPKLKAHIVDVFTHKPFAGNPAGVVMDASGLSEIQMQQIAREINLSETAFVVEKDLPDADFHIRFFTPLTEVDLCGHATIGTFFLLAEEGVISRDLPEIRVCQKTKAGILPLRILYRNDGSVNRVMMSQAPPKFREAPIEREELAEILRVSPDNFSDSYPLELAFTGLWHLMVFVNSREALDSLRPDYATLSEMNKNIGVVTTHLFTLDTVDPSSTVYCRDFAPAVGVNEDPVTGRPHAVR